MVLDYMLASQKQRLGRADQDRHQGIHPVPGGGGDDGGGGAADVAAIRHKLATAPRIWVLRLASHTPTGDALVEAIGPIAAATRRPGLLAGVGGFGALFEIPPGRYREPVLVSSTDGVGTKLKLAFAHTEVGARYDLARAAETARKAGKVWRIDGEKHVVLGAPLADKLVVSARTSGNPDDPTGISLFLVDRAAAGVSRHGRSLTP